MALADTARLIASLDLKGNFNAQIRSSEKALGAFETRLDKTQSRSFRAGQQIGTGIQRGAAIAAGGIAFLAANVGIGLKSLSELETVVTQTNAVLKSTKGVAGQTAESIRNLAEKYEGLNATIDDKVIQSGENVLLTFTAIRKDAFEPAIAAALDMSTALGTDLQGSVIQIGKALQDPIKGITALRRVGVNFSTDQIKVIKRLVETGHTLDAQRLILKELNTEFGGSFIAQGNTTAGKVAKFKDAIEDLQKALATALLPVIGKVSDALTKVLANPAVIKGANDIGQAIAGLFSDENLAKGADFLKGAFNTAKQAAPIVQAAAKATFGLVQGAVSLFKSLPAPLQQLAVGAFAINKLTGGLVTNVAGGVFDTVKDLVFKARGTTPANPLFVADVTGGLKGIAGAAGAAGGVGIRAAIMSQLSTAAIGIKALALPLLTTVAIPAILGLFAAGKLAGVGPFAENKTFARGGTLQQPRNTRTNADERLEAIYGATKAQTKSAELNARRIEAAENRTGSLISSAGKIISAQIHPLHAALKAQLGALKTATKNLDLQRLGKGIANLIAGKNVGNLDQTRDALRQLRSALGRTHDAKTAAILRAAIARVTAKLPAREFAAKAHAQAEKILRSSESTARKIQELKEIERSLKDRKLPDAANSIQRKIVAAQRDAKAAQVRASENVAAAVRRKKLQVTTNVSVPVTSYVSVQGILKKQQITSRYSQNRAQ